MRFAGSCVVHSALTSHSAHRAALVNLMHLGNTIITEVSSGKTTLYVYTIMQVECFPPLPTEQERVKESKHKLKRIDRVGEKYELSRWTPVVQDIAEVGSADMRMYTFYTTQVIDY